ncbi:phosphoribosylglycinamide formyltransferase [Candidatus Berkiella aquae]|uniref:Phosphoribosylglycinamide formyltransferase n=1 Tax=Candidatus Berkiella aquae TaxID=295108 RepID=A0A0Q9YYX4_9GAMM|nr:phosphoribosylglycinamide formyltransferase [Candidatus Berkiella aquae]MCS5710968.1 phosphoribosylglycinamide formyltransferase [Candidatus Berkiella aquae]
MKPNPCPVVVLIGGNGSNLQALIDSQQHNSHYQIVGVISHRENAFGLTRAEQAGIPTLTVDHQHFSSRDEFEAALQQAISSFSPKIVALAGFMRILSPSFITDCCAPILNIHPSLLPHYKGLNTHERVIAAKETQTGVSIHFVTDELDGGPIVAQVRVSILENDTIDSLKARVFKAEHWLYPQVISWFAQNRLKNEKNVVTLDGERLDPQGMQLSLPSAQGIVS